MRGHAPDDTSTGQCEHSCAPLKKRILQEWRRGEKGVENTGLLGVKRLHPKGGGKSELVIRDDYVKSGRDGKKRGSEKKVPIIYGKTLNHAGRNVRKTMSKRR